MSFRIAAAACLITLSAVTASSGALAQSVMKECGAEYQAAKAGNTLNGQKWQEFLAACRTRHAGAATSPATPAAGAASAPATTAPSSAPPASAPATASTAPATKAAKPVSGGQAAMRVRQKACGAEWKAQKVELRKTNPNLKWPQYWSECNKRMKAAAQ